MCHRVNKLHVFSKNTEWHTITTVSNLSHNCSSSVHWMSSYNGICSVTCMHDKVYMCVQKKRWGEVTLPETPQVS